MKNQRTLLTSIAFFVIFNINAQSNFVGSGLTLDFDGDASNYYDLGNNFNSLNFPLTLEAWVFQEEYELFGPIFSTDGSTSGNYYGFYARFSPVGNLIFEIGNGLGAGGAHRRGKTTTTIAPLNEWIHLAIVANSITDIKFYFNGVLQPSANTDGGATNTTILHNSNTANIGRYATVHRADAFNGKIDEVRLWNISRTEANIRDKMCEKLTEAEIGLIGYWIVDEDLTSTTVIDYSPSGIDANLVGIVNKLNSGAPIGNESVLIYDVDYAGDVLTLNSAGGDKLKVSKIGNLPYGVHLYRVDTAPFSTTGLSSYPSYYYGVFSANNATDAKYTLTYTYSYSNGIVTVVNEINSSLSKRLDGSVDLWTPQPAVLTTATKRLTKKNFIDRGEFIFNILTPNEPKVNVGSLADLKAYPVPASNEILIQGLEEGAKIEVVDISGRVVYVLDNAASNMLIINVEAFESGMYILKQSLNNSSTTLNFIVQH